MVEMMVRLSSCSNKVHGVVDDNNNCYRIMIIDAIRINQGDAGECLMKNQMQMHAGFLIF